MISREVNELVTEVGALLCWPSSRWRSMASSCWPAAGRSPGRSTTSGGRFAESVVRCDRRIGMIQAAWITEQRAPPLLICGGAFMMRLRHLAKLALSKSPICVKLQASYPRALFPLPRHCVAGRYSVRLASPPAIGVRWVAGPLAPGRSSPLAQRSARQTGRRLLPLYAPRHSALQR